MKNWNLSALIEKERNEIQQANYESENQLRMLFSGSSVISFLLIPTKDSPGSSWFFLAILSPKNCKRC